MLEYVPQVYNVYRVMCIVSCVVKWRDTLEDVPHVYCVMRRVPHVYHVMCREMEGRVGIRSACVLCDVQRSTYAWCDV